MLLCCEVLLFLVELEFFVTHINAIYCLFLTEVRLYTKDAFHNAYTAPNSISAGVASGWRGKACFPALT